MDRFPDIADYLEMGAYDKAKKMYVEELDRVKKKGYDDGLSDMLAIDDKIEEWIADGEFDRTVQQRATQLGLQEQDEHAYLGKDLIQTIHLAAHGDTGPYGWEFCSRCR